MTSTLRSSVPPSARPLVALLFTSVVGILPAQSGSVPADPLAGRSKKELEAARHALAEAVSGLRLPGQQACEQLARSIDTKATAHTRPFPVRSAKDHAPPPASRIAPLPLAVQYHSGTGLVEPVAPPKGHRADPGREAAEHALRLALLGARPDADRVLAALLRDLDTDRSADRFAAFLESWKNGDETFYEALDRTAGTQDSVFFYDAMLHEYTGAFAKGKDGKVVLRSLQAAHDALHDSFLAYRQYRAFREAIAWSLVLPPDLPLPEPLRRYEAPVEGAFSLRQQVRMLYAVHGGDPREVVRLVTAHADPLPEPLWSAKYDPYAKWNAAFAAALPTMTERAGNTDAFASQVREEDAAEASSLQAAALHALAPQKRAH